MKTSKQNLDELKSKLDDLISWSNERPEGSIEGELEYLRVKFRTPWFQHIVESIAVVREISDDEDRLLEEATALRDEILEKRSKNEYTTKEEINKGDQLIRRALEILEKQK